MFKPDPSTKPDPTVLDKILQDNFYESLTQQESNDADHVVFTSQSFALTAPDKIVEYARNVKIMKKDGHTFETLYGIIERDAVTGAAHGKALILNQLPQEKSRSSEFMNSVESFTFNQGVQINAVKGFDFGFYTKSQTDLMRIEADYHAQADDILSRSAAGDNLIHKTVSFFRKLIS